MNRIVAPALVGLALLAPVTVASCGRGEPTPDVVVRRVEHTQGAQATVTIPVPDTPSGTSSWVPSSLVWVRSLGFTATAGSADAATLYGTNDNTIAVSAGASLGTYFGQTFLQNIGNTGSALGAYRYFAVQRVPGGAGTGLTFLIVGDDGNSTSSTSTSTSASSGGTTPVTGPDGGPVSVEGFDGGYPVAVVGTLDGGALAVGIVGQPVAVAGAIGPQAPNVSLSVVQATGSTFAVQPLCDGGPCATAANQTTEIAFLNSIANSTSDTDFNTGVIAGNTGVGTSGFGTYLVKPGTTAPYQMASNVGTLFGTTNLVLGGGPILIRYLRIRNNGTSAAWVFLADKNGALVNSDFTDGVVKDAAQIAAGAEETFDYPVPLSCSTACEVEASMNNNSVGLLAGNTMQVLQWWF